MPLYLSRTTDPEIIFEIREQTDYAAKALADYDEAMQKKKNPPKGISRYVVAIGTDGKEIEITGALRRQLFEDSAKVTAASEAERELLEEGLIERKPAGGYDASEYGDGLIDSASSD